jgi:hypothetical protein
VDPGLGGGGRPLLITRSRRWGNLQPPGSPAVSGSDGFAPTLTRGADDWLCSGSGRRLSGTVGPR